MTLQTDRIHVIQGDITRHHADGAAARTYRFPVGRAAPIAIAEIAAGLEVARNLERATMVCFDTATLATYQAALEQRRSGGRREM